MPKVIYIQPDGVEKEVDVAVGKSLMEAAVQNDVAGIDAECGGACVCATCHVYVVSDNMSGLSELDELENEMLETTSSERKPTSRLSCQIKMTDALEGIRLQIPPFQS